MPVPAQIMPCWAANTENCSSVASLSPDWLAELVKPAANRPESRIRSYSFDARLKLWIKAAELLRCHNAL
jgi:hypothetical protein